MANTVRSMDNAKRIFTVSLSVPKTMGNGPTTITPPPFVSDFPFVIAVCKARRTAARKVIANPAMTRTNPTVSSNDQSNIGLAKIDTKE